MKLLAIECATDACSVALDTGSEVLLDHRLAPQQHTALVLPVIDRLMSEAGLGPADLDGVACGHGPGSFTGVRIALSVAQGIAMGASIGVQGVSTLAVLAQACLRHYGDERVLVALDARMGEIYAAHYAISPSRFSPVSDGRADAAGVVGVMQLVGEEQACKPATVPPQMVVAGSGAERYRDALQATCLRESLWPSAEEVLTLALARPDAFGAVDTLVPGYIRNRVALTTEQRAAGEAL